MDINSFIVGFSKGKKGSKGFVTTEENDAGGKTYKFSAKPDTKYKDLSEALIDGSLTHIECDCESVRKYAFAHCDVLTSVYFPNVKSIGDNSFDDCSALTSVDFPNATSIGLQAFRSCTALTSVYFPNVKSVGDYTFPSCTALTSVNLPNVTSIGQYMFMYDYVLRSVDFPNATSIGANAFGYCRCLTTVILRSESLCNLSSTNAFGNCYHILGTVNATHNPNGDKDGYIYVPSALVESYKNATNWSTYASQFRALEDYTVDGTITGELDPNKI